jgi:CheY-like chemotaxis protein
LITDVMMPGMDGGELACVARAERPDLKILLTSGYTDDTLIDHGIEPGGQDFLEKPYGAHVLAGRVRQIIDAA